MTRADALSLHELSYLCGGPQRAVLTAVLALCQSGQLELSGEWVRQLNEPPAELDPVEQAVIDFVPAAGIQLRPIFATVAKSDAVRQTRGMLVSRRLASRWPGLTRAGRQVRREVATCPPDGLRRIAALGPEAIPDTQLRDVFTKGRRAAAPLPVRRDAVWSA